MSEQNNNIIRRGNNVERQNQSPETVHQAEQDEQTFIKDLKLEQLWSKIPRANLVGANESKLYDIWKCIIGKIKFINIEYYRNRWIRIDENVIKIDYLTW